MEIGIGREIEPFDHLDISVDEGGSIVTRNRSHVVKHDEVTIDVLSLLEIERSR